MSFPLIRTIFIKILPESLYKVILKFYLTCYYLFIFWNYKIIIKRVQKKDTIKVAFFLIHDSVWKYEGVYRLMAQNHRFEPIVIVCPYIMYGEEFMLRDMEQAYTSFLKKGYNVVKTYNTETNEWLNVKKDIMPDIIFFTNPLKLTRDEYYITNYSDCLTCYVQYSFTISHLNEGIYNQFFHNVLWKAFYETEIHRQFAVKYALNKGRNVVIAGYPGIDQLIDGNYIPEDKWKIKDRRLKRLIWAPHHTIDDDKSFLSYSNFLYYYQFMFDIAERFADKIQMAFKPHPILKAKLYQLEDWGKEKTEAYYLKWQNLSNGQLETGDYIDLFLTSDAMIHDSGSFMAEYLFVHKPTLFIVRDNDIAERFNSFGKMVFNQLYHAMNQNDILQFIEDVVLNGKDIKSDERNEFVMYNMLPPNNCSASMNIYNEIIQALN